MSLSKTKNLQNKEEQMYLGRTLSKRKENQDKKCNTAVWKRGSQFGLPMKFGLHQLSLYFLYNIYIFIFLIFNYFFFFLL